MDLSTSIDRDAGGDVQVDGKRPAPIQYHHAAQPPAPIVPARPPSLTCRPGRAQGVLRRPR
jgi:hypothetical protein